MVSAVYHLDPKDGPKQSKVSCALYIDSDSAPKPQSKKWMVCQGLAHCLVLCLISLCVIYLVMGLGAKKNQTRTVGTADTPSLSTPPIYGKWEYLKETDQYYMPIKGYFDFDSCGDLCVKNGSQMVSIHSDIENEFVFKLITTGRMDGDHNDCAWIGTHRCQIIRPVGPPGWCNVDGSPVDYVHWDNWNGHPEPNNSDGSEDCVEMYSDKSCPGKLCRAKWNDIDCDWKHRLCVCKKAAL